jgi:imidazolonepropionase-like amidohydrolase
MSPSRIVVPVLLVLSALKVFAEETPSRPSVIPQPFLALTGARAIDVRSGSIVAGTVVLREGRIVSVGAEPAPSGAEVIDLGGRFVLPGLMDAHTHLDKLSEARRALDSGVTTVRSASVGSYRDVALREMSKKGYIAGPDMLAAGVYVTPNLEETILADPELGALIGGVDSPEKLRLLVRVNLAHGVDVIKTRGTERAGTPATDPREQVYTEGELLAVVEEAATGGVPVFAHAHGDEGSRAAVLAGVRSIDHGTYLSDATLALMKERGTYFVPTYATVVDLVEPGGDYDHPVVNVRGRHMLPRLERSIQKALELGVPIVTGADTRYGPESVTRVSHEVAHLVRLGMTPLQAIQSATIVAAGLLRIESKTGALEPGLEADLIVVEENPLQDIRNLQDVLMVVSNGRLALNRLPFAKGERLRATSGR